MNISSLSSGGAETDTKTCVVYAVGSGEILHIHTITVFPGGSPATVDDLAQEAIELARRQQHVGGEFGVQQVPQHQVHELAHGARINPESRDLIANRKTTGKRNIGKKS